MKKYKLIASDIDGTLLNSRYNITDENISAIRTLLDSGVHFVLSTGRTYKEIPDKIKNLEEIRFFICSNGSVIYDKVYDKTYINGISKELSNSVLDILYSFDSHITVRHNGECYIDESLSDDKALELYNVWINHKNVLRNYGINVRDFRKFVYSLDNVEVFSVFFVSDEEKTKCRSDLEKLGNLTIVEACDHNLEIIDINSGKGNALRILSDILRLDPAETISVGDSDNDKSMIEVAGLGLAVSNSSDQLKAVADEVICSNDEHVIQYILRNYIVKEL